MLDPHFVILGALLNLIGSLLYVRKTVQGKVKPNRVTWFMWALAPLVAFSAEINKGVGLQALMTFMVGFGPLMIFIATFINKKSFWRLTSLDIICGVLSLMGLILWLLTREGNIAIALAIAADGLAGVPTIVKAYKEPRSESSWVFLAGSISAGVTLLTVSDWSLAAAGFPLYILIICLLLIFLINFRFDRRILETV